MFQESDPEFQAEFYEVRGWIYIPLVKMGIMRGMGRKKKNKVCKVVINPRT